MDGQYLQLGSTTPFVRLQFLSTVDGSNVTTLVFNTAALAISYARDTSANVAITLVTATLGTWVSGGFIHRGAGVYDLYLPTAAVIAGAKSLAILSTGLPASTVMLNCVVPMGADDISLAGETASTISAAVVASEAASFTAIPSAVVSAGRVETTLTSWGVTVQPTGGSTIQYIEKRNGATIGTRTAFFDAFHVCVGMTAVV